ncbi:hypothetical protein Q73A0000_11195 [Kaistella flava (ex Peng et al. 2021)]|uniref:Streptomycin biosynthesis protein StrF domain-containing protein n=1 Tax=Kaistella flava (ex Peng et al. 2021) TaxID=2038776 RepID=A0A7M2Y9Q6_9FLAO|nr:glycosyltransferase [Kaistella flava (ex Peng et al. 2021)]QOW10881.1 hypothetical protein Q73A0000_11195 [Kaistella flava (ex Peng et al. 2021)]
MLSIIISSYQEKYFSTLQKNIAETIGIDYEIVKIENPNLMGICEAYNHGAKKAKYENLLFIHEDVEFITQNWGDLLIQFLNRPNWGIIGLAGCKYVPNVPFAWWDKFENSFRNLHQFNKNTEVRNYNISEYKEVLAIDGVFLACRKKIHQEFPFNENIKGFHGYDLDFSVRVAEKYSNLLAHNIKLKHFSEGNPNKEWWDDILKNRKLFKAPSKQKIDKKTELYFYRKLEERLNLNHSKHKKKILLRYNDPRFIGFKISLKNIFNLIFND